MIANTSRALPVALLLMAGLFGGHPASAQVSAPAAARPVQIEFDYHRAAPAADLYESLERTAANACKGFGVRSLHVRAQEQACIAALLEAAVEKIARPDLAELFHGRFDQG